MELDRTVRYTYYDPCEDVNLILYTIRSSSERKASTIRAGNTAGGSASSFAPSLSNDGKLVAFTSTASNLVTQLYLVCLVVTGLPLALSVRQQLEANLAVRKEQRRTEAVIDSSTTPIMLILSPFTTSRRTACRWPEFSSRRRSSTSNGLAFPHLTSSWKC